LKKKVALPRGLEPLFSP